MLGGNEVPNPDGHPLWRTVVQTLLQVSAFVALMLVAGRRVLPWLLWQVSKTGSRELFTLSVVASIGSVCELPTVMRFFNGNPNLGLISGGIDQFTGPPGTALWFDANLLHGSGSNITPLPRSNVFLVFNSVHNRLGEPFAAPRPRPHYLAAR